jgi:hypothetical protein
LESIFGDLKATDLLEDLDKNTLAEINKITFPNKKKGDAKKKLKRKFRAYLDQKIDIDKPIVDEIIKIINLS